MAVRVDLNKNQIASMITAAIASLKRATNKTGINPMMTDLINKDIAAYQNALNTMSEIK